MSIEIEFVENLILSTDVSAYWLRLEILEIQEIHITFLKDKLLLYSSTILR